MGGASGTDDAAGSGDKHWTPGWTGQAQQTMTAANSPGCQRFAPTSSVPAHPCTLRPCSFDRRDAQSTLSRGCQEVAAAAWGVPSERLATRARWPLNVSRASGVSVASATMAVTMTSHNSA